MTVIKLSVRNSIDLYTNGIISRDEARQGIGIPDFDLEDLRRRVAEAESEVETLRSDFLTVRDERDEFLSQLEDARAELAAKAERGKPLAKGDWVRITRDTAVLNEGDQHQVLEPLPDNDGDIKVVTPGDDYEYVSLAFVERIGSADLVVDSTVAVVDDEPEFKPGDRVRVAHGRGCVPGELVEGSEHVVSKFDGAFLYSDTLPQGGGWFANRFVKVAPETKAQVFEGGATVIATANCGFDVKLGDRLTVRALDDGEVIDEDGDLRVFTKFGREDWVKPEHVRKPRVFNVGDPEPEDADTIVLTGEGEGGRTVELRRKDSTFFPGGLSWWDHVNGKANTQARWGYWLDVFGPLTEA